MTDFSKFEHLVFYSGGICSWAAADRVIQEFGRKKVLLYFNDTKIEDPDLRLPVILDELLCSFSFQYAAAVVYATVCNISSISEHLPDIPPICINMQSHIEFICGLVQESIELHIKV